VCRRALIAGRLIVFLLLSSGAAGMDLPAHAQQSALKQMRAGFENPPQGARARCYWWWLNGNTTAATITRDLEGMKAKGFGGAILVDADGSGEQGNREAAEGPAIGSPAWMKLFVHALAEAKRLGIEISLNVTSRWNVGIIGGQTVTPEDALKQLTWSRVVVKGGAQSTVHLQAPAATNGFYRPIATLAYPLHHGAPLPGKPGSQRAAIPGLLIKTATIEAGFSMPHDEKILRTRPSEEGEEDARVDEVMDLSAQVNAEGDLTCRLPAGTWEILSVGYTDTPKKLLDAAKRVRGLPLDVLSTESFDRYWKQAVMPLLDAAKPYIGTSLRYLVTDSWESGGTNWTANFRAEFRKRRGYDPVVYLPIVSGRILSSRNASEEFLFDLRRTVADLITENHYDHFAALAAQAGLGTHPESGGPHGAPIDALGTFRSASFPQTEFWADSGWHRVKDEERFFVKEASSAAHIYGKTIVAAEGPTSMHRLAWSETLAGNVQPTIDRAFTEGLNRIFWHEFTSSPEKYGKPGQEYFAGTHLNPNVTWWQQAGPFLKSLNRAQFLLQQGQPASDLLYFYGNQVPNFVRVKNDDPAHVLPGYDYDVTGEDALLQRMRLDGEGLATPEGVRYRALALPGSGKISLEALKWIERFVRQGGTVIGLKPDRPLGTGSPEALTEYRRIADAMWAGCTEKTVKSAYGKDTVVCTGNARNGFAALGIAPDFSYRTSVADPQPVQSPVLDFVHRTADGADIYFVRNSQPRAVRATLSFRVEGKGAELWSPEDGSIAPIEIYRATADRRTEIPLAFPAYGSVFIVFKGKPANHLTSVEREGVAVHPSIGQGGDVYYSSEGMVATEAGNYTAIDAAGKQNRFAVADTRGAMQTAHWNLTFPSGWGAPASVAVKSFQSWTESADPGVRYFSGTATYRTTIDLAASPTAHPLWMRMGEVREIATVRVNGANAGTVWQAPYTVRIDKLLHAGKNTIEIEVSNLWPNRIIGDLQPGAHRFTQTNSRAYTKDSPLLPSGILGPVVIVTGEAMRWKPVGGDNANAEETAIGGGERKKER
jgi:hypothetical protein